LQIIVAIYLAALASQSSRFVEFDFLSVTVKSRRDTTAYVTGCRYRLASFIARYEQVCFHTPTYTTAWLILDRVGACICHPLYLAYRRAMCVCLRCAPLNYRGQRRQWWQTLLLRRKFYTSLSLGVPLTSKAAACFLHRCTQSVKTLIVITSIFLIDR